MGQVEDSKPPHRWRPPSAEPPRSRWRPPPADKTDDKDEKKKYDYLDAIYELYLQHLWPAQQAGKKEFELYNLTFQTSPVLRPEEVATKVLTETQPNNETEFYEGLSKDLNALKAQRDAPRMSTALKPRRGWWSLGRGQ
jgi:hypothetical protein